MKRKLLIIGLLLVFITSLAGCLGRNQQKEDKTNQPPADTKVNFTVYFSDDQAMYLKGEKRTVSKDDKSEAELMIGELLKGPDSQELSPTIPEGTKLLSLEVKNKIALVDFSKEIQTNHSGGTAGESMTVYSIVNTLAQLPDIEAVQFLIEGKEQEAIWGHLYTLEPIEPNPELVK